MSQNYDKELNRLAEEVERLAKSKRHDIVTAEHLLYVLSSGSDSADAITELGGNTPQIQEDTLKFIENEIRSIPDSMYQGLQHISLGPCLRRVFEKTVHKLTIAGEEPHPKTVYYNMIESMLDEPNSYATRFLLQNGVSKESVEEALSKHRSGMDPSKSAVAQFCVNLNEEAKEGKIDPVIGRDMEISDTVEILARRKKNNVVMVGDPGVGKTAVAEGLARMIQAGIVPETLKDKNVFSLNIGSLIAGTKFRGDFEERMKSLLDEIKERDDVVLFIDEIHTIMGAGAANGGSIDVSNLLKPMLARGEIRCIGATTYDEYTTHFEKDKALMRRFEKLDIKEPSVEDTKKIVRSIKGFYGDYHKVKYSNEIVEACVDLSVRYIKQRFLPDKAIDVIDAAGARAKLNKNEHVSEDDVIHQVSKFSKIPVEMIDVKDNDNIATLERRVKNKVFGQDEAIDIITDSITVSKAGLRSGNKPIGNFLFVGPTGVGKTHLAKQLAESLGTELERFDMSEYMEGHTVSKFIGAPPGYVGHGEGKSGNGQLITAVENNPNCVLLLDEIEKAHPQVVNILLQVMDDGCLTNSNGKTVSFSNVILIMTSNAGASDAEKNNIGFIDTGSDGVMKKAVESFFSPEFRNRLDSVVQFNKLSRKEIDMIVLNEVNEINEMLRDKNVTVSLTKPARDWIAENGFDDKMGARPLSRLVFEKIKTPLSREVLMGALVDGGLAEVKVENNDISFVFSTEENASQGSLRESV